MGHSVKEVSEIVGKGSASRAPAHTRPRSRSRAGILSALGLAALWVSACSAGDAGKNGATPDAKESNRGDFGQNDIDSTGSTDSTNSADSADSGGGTVRLKRPYLSGTCTDKAAGTVSSEDARVATVIFDNQQYAGDRNSPDYIAKRTQGRLIGDAKSTAPKCVLHMPMSITAGYRVSPTDIVINGFAHRGFVFGAYRWANAALPSPANGYDVTNDGYTFERQVPKNEDLSLGGDNFSYPEPLYNLWSPTCAQSGSGQVDAELIVTIQPYTAAGTNDTIVAIDSFNVTGYGAIEKCNKPTSYNQVAQEGEACNIIEKDYVHPVRCDTSKQNNICVYYDTNQETGTCVNASKPPSASDRVVGYDGECGGPFYKYCSTSEPLACRFVSGDARQNASSHFGRCVRPIAIGEQCNKDLFGACDGNSCNTKADPCQTGSKCTNGKCTATKGNSLSADTSEAN